MHILQELGISGLNEAPVDAVVGAIEKQLGERKFMEQARWYLLSVLRHSTAGRWQLPRDSGLSPEQQQHLAQALLDQPEARSSLASILRNRKSRYKLVEFASTANSRDQIFSTTSKAYVCARQLLENFDPAVSAATQAQRETIANRRARRRQRAVDNSAYVVAKQVREGQQRNELPRLSASEIERLEKAVQTPVNERFRRRAIYRSREDKLSVLAGFATGVVVFLLLWLIFW